LRSTYSADQRVILPMIVLDRFYGLDRVLSGKS
jgi:hypothetical protein